MIKLNDNAKEQDKRLKIIWIVQKCFEVDYTLEEIKGFLEKAGYNPEEKPDEGELRDAIDCALGDDLDSVVGDMGPQSEDYKPFLAASTLQDDDFEDTKTHQIEEPSNGEA